MMSRLVVVTGTGTNIGKTHLSEALVAAGALRSDRVVGLKPIESGIAPAVVSDSARLERWSTFHVEQFGHFYADPVSPHLAARRAGEPIRVDPILATIDSVRESADLVLVELPGGLFTPLSDTMINADLARDLDPDAVLLVAPDRLGVLHDVLAAQRAAETVPLVLSGVWLVTPEVADASTGSNAEELRRLSGLPTVQVLPRAPVATLRGDPAVTCVIDALLGTASAPR